jgi:hypothetical protein
LEWVVWGYPKNQSAGFMDSPVIKAVNIDGTASSHGPLCSTIQPRASIVGHTQSGFPDAKFLAELVAQSHS